MRAERKLDYGARGAGSEMGWDHDESTTQVWTGSRALRAIHVANRIERARTVPPPPPPRIPGPSAYPPPYAMVTHAPLSMPALSLAPVTLELELEQPEVAVPWLLILTGAAGLFGSVLFMQILIAPVAVPATKVASSPVPTAAATALAVEGTHGDATPRVVEPEAAAPPSDLRKASRVTPADTNTPPRSIPPASIPHVAKLKPEQKSAAAARPLAATVAARATAKPHASKAAPARQPAAAVAPATTPAEPGASGTLRVNSLPWAEVYIDDVFVGNTPRNNLSVKPGRHRLKLVNRPLEMEKTLVVEIRAAQVVTKIVNLSQ